MRTSAICALVLFAALALSGCSDQTGQLGLSATIGANSASATAATQSAPTAPETAIVATPPPSGTSPNPVGTVGTATSQDPVVATIQAVIQKANQKQQEAFEKGDPTVMKDTATSSYYQRVAQINRDMAQGGIATIQLIKIEWGEIKLTNPTTAHATTFETWRTGYSDGATGQRREQNDYTLVLDQGSWKIQSDDNPGASGGLSPGQAGSGGSGSVGPVSPPTPDPAASGEPATGSDLSRNWAGYAATSGTFTAVTGSWTVPEPRNTGQAAGGATWVGIGGVDTSDLIQAGTMESIDGSGGVTYAAWIETLPQAARPVPFDVKAGDSVTVSIRLLSQDQWRIELTNNTTQESYQTSVQYSSSLSSAEWVEEAPTAGRRIVPIEDFGTVQFSSGSAVKNGSAVTIAEAGSQPISMSGSRSGVAVTPSILTPDGGGFSVSQNSPVPTPQSRPRSLP